MNPFLELFCAAICLRGDGFHINTASLSCQKIPLPTGFKPQAHQQDRHSRSRQILRVDMCLRRSTVHHHR